jgi:hypothetical protein
VSSAAAAGQPGELLLRPGSARGPAAPAAQVPASQLGAAALVRAGVAAAGVIGHNDSGDYFRISAGAGALDVQVDITSAWVGYASHSRANLDTKLSLLSAVGAVLASSNPTGEGGPQGQAS